MADKPNTDKTPDTANERVFDATLRHQIGIRRFAAGEVAVVLGILERADADLVARLEGRLRGFAGRPVDFTSRRYRRLIEDVRALRDETHLAVRRTLRPNLLDLARTEQEFERRILQSAIPVELEFATASAAALNALVRSRPFSGGANAARTLQGWFENLERADKSRLVEAINQGVVQQESVDQIVARVRGTRRFGFQNGALAATRRNAEAIVRTAVNHVSNAAREEFHLANRDVVRALRWTSTLDGRTSRICAARDGRFAPLLGETAGENVPTPRLDPPTARPPAHPSCRSVMVAIADPEGVARRLPDRPFVRDVRTGRRRQVDFRVEARRQGISLAEARRRWARRNVGRVPGDVTYDGWLRRQSREFQDEVLGPTRARAFREGLRVDKFVDRRGNELNLSELRQTRPEFFQAEA